ncbi:interferon-inducible GTPase-domain-containing protein [Xylaria arbuscula]|nr:interferon-inducible GTPase-domain-containing protein [Xylaria arbuscula]
MDRPSGRSSSEPFVGFNWTFGKGWGVVAKAQGREFGRVPVHPAIGIATTVVAVSVALLSWASPNGTHNHLPLTTPELIRQQRQEEGFEPNSTHVVVCGPANSGKSSIINALRGLRNRDNGAATTGTPGSTTHRTKYAGHASFNSLQLHDCPGAGTLRTPADGYYSNQRLYLYDLLLIVAGERIGELEIQLMKTCIRSNQRFRILRSKSGMVVDQMTSDRGIDRGDAQNSIRDEQTNALAEELRRADTANNVINELKALYILVNNNDLRDLTVTNIEEWPEPHGRTEIDERQLLCVLGKRGASDTTATSS